MSKVLFMVQGKPVHRGDTLHVSPHLFYCCGSTVRAEFSADGGDSVTVRSENGAVPHIAISELSWHPHPDTSTIEAMAAAGWRQPSKRDIRLWLSALATQPSHAPDALAAKGN